MSPGPKGKSAEKEVPTAPAPVHNGPLVGVTIWDCTRTSSWQVQFPSGTTSQELIRALVASLRLPSSQAANREIRYVLDAVDGKQGHRFAAGESIGDYLAQNPNAFLILLPELTAG
jgi:hypothetical protein